MSARYPDPDPSDPWARPQNRPAYPGRSGSGTDSETEFGSGWGLPGSGQPSWGTPTYPPYAARPPIVTARDLGAGLVVIALSAVLGVATGFAWLALAPKLELVVRGDSAVPARPEGEALIGVDGTFALIVIGAGVLCAIIAYLWQRRRSIGVVCALAAGGALAAKLAAYVGQWAGPAALATHRGDPDGTVFTHPLILRATGVILLWPIAALLVYLALTLLFDHEDRRRGDGGWYHRPW